MKKLLIIMALILVSNTGTAQDKLYLIFEFMKVDNEQEQAYMETEAFWKEIHVQRVKNGDILGWDLWSLQPGGEDQGYQYLTVTIYNDPLKMMTSAGDFEAALKAAYPDMPEDDLNEKFYNTGKSRDLAKRIYLEQIAVTKGDFEMPLGTVAAINIMKVSQEDYSTYEQNESELFMPMHQKEVDDGFMGNWNLLRYILPTGSDVYATHITADMYKDYDQLFKSWANERPALSEDEIRKIEDALKTRDLKYRYMATLLRKVR
ncbi:hypothetical protein SAMN05660776_2176 [Salegentibacter holothuriorum]|uniref:NIPSNAP protein n=1 Tax=Salegentibacter holothuriorum TaxID=241145 RepID=A0A1T5CS43_9FLAO|nr:hypothetical protein [Salegentibacter holothuriorum]SKB62244.1 hypothetical protein SAMN05660776_2176 [Salegentibacter holothuriorum]